MHPATAKALYAMPGFNIELVTPTKEKLCFARGDMLPTAIADQSAVSISTVIRASLFNCCASGLCDIHKRSVEEALKRESPFSKSYRTTARVREARSSLLSDDKAMKYKLWMPENVPDTIRTRAVILRHLGGTNAQENLELLAKCVTTADGDAAVKAAENWCLKNSREDYWRLANASGNTQLLDTDHAVVARKHVRGMRTLKKNPGSKSIISFCYPFPLTHDFSANASLRAQWKNLPNWRINESLPCYQRTFDNWALVHAKYEVLSRERYAKKQQELCDEDGQPRCLASVADIKEESEQDEAEGNVDRRPGEICRTIYCTALSIESCNDFHKFIILYFIFQRFGFSQRQWRRTERRTHSNRFARFEPNF